MTCLWGRRVTGMKEKPPLRDGWERAVKYSSPWHAEKCCILPILSEQGRYFFHDGSELGGGVPCWGGISFMEARWKWRWCPWSVSTGLRCPWSVAGPASKKSHVIRLGEVLTKSENVAIPTIQFQDLKGSWGNYVRNWVWAQQ